MLYGTAYVNAKNRNEHIVQNTLGARYVPTDESMIHPERSASAPRGATPGPLGGVAQNAQNAHSHKCSQCSYTEKGFTCHESHGGGRTTGCRSDYSNSQERQRNSFRSQDGNPCGAIGTAPKQLRTSLPTSSLFIQQRKFITALRRIGQQRKL